MSDLWTLDAAGLVEAYRAGSADPVEALEAARDRIARLDPALGAFVAPNPQARAEAEASAARWRAGAPLGTLDGVPVALKDNLAARGMPARWGGPTFPDAPLAQDELPVARLRAAGAVALGKTNTPEFAVEGYTGNALFGDTGNPWAPDLTPGGSSGGSVAAVAAGMATLALGTDGGGSLRRPAAYCGLFSLKAGIGRYARAGGLPQVLLDMEVVGGLTRSARDLALLDAVLAGPDRRDPRARAQAPEAPVPQRPRILFVERFGDAPLDPVIAARLREAAAALAADGCAVTEGALPFDVAPLSAMWPEIAKIGLARLAETLPGFAQASPKYRAMADEGAALPATRLLAIIEEIDRLRSAASRAFAEIDLILTPACAAQPWPKGESHPPEIDGVAVGPRGHAIYTGWVNAIGCPALSAPCGRDAHGSPVGLQLVADLGGEPLLLTMAARCERLFGGWSAWPAMATAPAPPPPARQSLPL
ncbi:MAG: amidase [Rubrimonas sp.]|uniref:amidase n=1 Tax=Rubrimonas sp. TaxID=2036015 RepID=UPI002FDEB06A